jgi:hypothetical protein
MQGCQQVLANLTGALLLCCKHTTTHNDNDMLSAKP